MLFLSAHRKRGIAQKIASRSFSLFECALGWLCLARVSRTGGD